MGGSGPLLPAIRQCIRPAVSTGKSVDKSVNHALLANVSFPTSKIWRCGIVVVPHAAACICCHLCTLQYCCAKACSLLLQRPGARVKRQPCPKCAELHCSMCHYCHCASQVYRESGHGPSHRIPKVWTAVTWDARVLYTVTLYPDRSALVVCGRRCFFFLPAHAIQRAALVFAMNYGSLSGQ
jgi:hypothetical protein